MTEPYRDPALPVEERVKDLLSRMTRKEKIGQLSQVCKRVCKSQEAFDQLIADGRVGSRILSDGGFAGNQGAGLSISDLNACQKVAVEQSRLGIPLIFGRDVIYGQRTIFPIPLGQAAAFNPDLVEEAYTCIAREASAVGVHWTFAPVMDVARDPRWGRIIEGSGEDPWLAARMAEVAVKGLQGADPSDPERILACAKHFVAYGAAEGGRDYDTAEVSENTMRNVYLPPFKAAVDAGLASVMSAFQDVGGVPASANRELLTGVLKEEWGFDGFVVSDWGAVVQLKGHGVAANDKEAACLAFDAGVDMEMTISSYDTYMEQLIDEGAISEERLDDAVRRILRTKLRAGLFEHPYVDEALWPGVLLHETHRQKALQLAEESIVMVRNADSILPLQKTGLRIGVIGPFVHEKRPHLGSWTLDCREEDTVSIAEGLRLVAPDADIVISDTALSDGENTLLQGSCYGRAGVDLAIVCVGESHTRHGEARCIAELALPPGQEELIELVAKNGIPLVVVCSSGRPLPMPAAERHAAAILYTWNAGTCAGEAIARVLFGDAEPGGRLPMSIPKNSSQLPVYYNRKLPGKTAGWADPYRYYLDQEFGPLHPFGFGLGYTTFELDRIAVSTEKIPVEGQVEVSARLRNTGNRSGSAVVQCYINDPVASTVRPCRELKGFRKVQLGSGEETHVTFCLGPDELAFYGRERRWRVEPGEFRVFLGFDSTADLQIEFRVGEPDEGEDT